MTPESDAAPGEQRPHADRRRDFKAGVLVDLADLMTGDVWGSWADHAEELGLSDITVESVTDEISRELQRRALRLLGPRNGRADS